ncbi:MAG: hypothetical protein H6719_16350 [Sandaracinaceae bacterium]|nr:hypothetical protein [Sandaracinaceae bacterium]
MGGTLLLCASLALGCGSPNPRGEAPAPATVDEEVGAAMEPIAPRPPAPPPAEPVVAAPAVAVTHTVIRGERRLGWHRFFPETLNVGPWVVEGASTEPGDEAVEVIGRTIEGCRTSEVGATQVTWCPDVGVVARVGREGSWYVDEHLAAAHFDDGTTWGSTPCDGMSFIDAAERRTLCERPIRALGAGPRRDGESCRWRYTLDGPGAHDAVVEVRLGPAAELEAWTGPARARTSIARGEHSAVAVRIDGATCGERDGAAFAERLASLTPN